MIARVPEEYHGQVLGTAGPAHQLVVVHLGDHVVPAELLAVLVQLLAEADAHGLGGGLAVDDHALAEELRGEVLRGLLDGGLVVGEHRGGLRHRALEVAGDDAEVLQQEELLHQRIGQHGARWVAAGDHDVVQALLPRQFEHGAAAGDAGHAGALAQGLVHGGERFLGVAAVAAGDHQRSLAHVAGEVVVVVHLDRAGGLLCHQLRRDPATDATASETSDHHVGERPARGVQLGRAADGQGFLQLFRKGVDQLVHGCGVAGRN